MGHLTVCLHDPRQHVQRYGERVRQQPQAVATRHPPGQCPPTMREPTLPEIPAAGLESDTT